MNLELSDHLTLATMFSGAVVTFKMIERGFEWATKKLQKEDRVPKAIMVVKLATEDAQVMRETARDVHEVKEICQGGLKDIHEVKEDCRNALKLLEKTDPEGRPLIYGRK